MAMAATNEGTEIPSTEVVTSTLSSHDCGRSAAATPSPMPPTEASSMAANASHSVPGKRSSSSPSTSWLLWNERRR